MSTKLTPQQEIDKILKLAQKKIDKILREAHLEVSAYETEIELENHPSRGCWGFCYTFWETRKRILKQKYCINWKTPAERNPGVIYD